MSARAQNRRRKQQRLGDFREPVACGEPINRNPNRGARKLGYVIGTPSSPHASVCWATPGKEDA